MIKTVIEILKSIWSRQLIRRIFLCLTGWILILVWIYFWFEQALFKNIALYFICLFIYTVSSTLFSSSETAFNSLYDAYTCGYKSKAYQDLKENIEKYFSKVENRPAKRESYIWKVLEGGYPKFISLVLIFNTIVNLVGLVFVSFLINENVEGRKLNALLCTLSILVFGEIAAKILAKRRTFDVVGWTIYPIYFLWWLLGEICVAMLFEFRTSRKQER